MARLLVTVSLVLAVVIFESPAGKADISAEVFGRISPAIAQVRARNCRDGEARSGTGFLYDRGDRLVTALHVVAGCTRIDAFFERAGGRTIIASVDRVLERVDLALLRLERSAGTPLIASGDRPAANDELSVIAFFLGAPTMDNKPLRVTFGNSKLSSMLPAQVRDDLARSQALDIGMEIVRLDGHLLPGASGAPLVDRQGRVVAIGSGGLKSGAASISWGLLGEHLERLVRS
jgi:S1-C subfamily serine protease